VVVVVVVVVVGVYHNGRNTLSTLFMNRLVSHSSFLALKSISSANVISSRCSVLPVVMLPKVSLVKTRSGWHILSRLHSRESMLIRTTSLSDNRDSTSRSMSCNEHEQSGCDTSSAVLPKMVILKELAVH
jgi:hypothetical protein